MILSDFKIHALRNILSVNLTLNSKFNFITGPNGSGKTSLLEALYLLSCGHSFRSREISPIISHGQTQLTVYAKSDREDSISIQKSHSDPTQIKLNNQFCSTTSQLAYALPCQIFYSDIFQIIDAGPSVRRSVLDWGLFHVKHNYLSLWKEYKRVLKQRNFLLKKHYSYDHFIPWDIQLSTLSDQMDALRIDYFKQWSSIFNRVLLNLTDVHCELHYYKGWDRKNTGRSLQEILVDSFDSDTQKLYTQYGAHQADILIETDKSKAKQYLSRGQQKIILIALKLAQGEMLEQDCLYLFDDLTAEIDDFHLNKLLEYLACQKGQFVITSLTPINAINYLSNQNHSIFYINAGIITNL